MKPKTLILLSVLLLACLGYVVIQRISSRDTDAPVSDNLLGRIPDGFARIRIENPRRGETTVFERRDNGWYITSPIELRADDASLMLMERALGTLKILRIIPGEQVNVQSTGLESPAWHVGLTTLGGDEFTFDVGSPAPRIGTGDAETYVRHTPPGRGSKPQFCVVACDFDALFDHPTESFRTHHILEDIDPASIESIQLTGQHAWVLSRHAGGWRLDTAATSTRALPDLPDAILQRLRELYVNEFVASDDLAGFGLSDDALATVRLTQRLGDGESKIITLTLGNTTSDLQQYYASITGTDGAIVVSSEFVQQLQIPADALRDRRVLDFDAGHVTGIQIVRPDSEIHLSQIDGQWTMTDPLTGQADTQAVSNLLAALSQLQAISFLDHAAPDDLGLTDPTTKIILMLRDQNAPLVLNIGNQAPDGAVFVSSSQQSTVFTIDPAFTQILTAQAGTYYNHTLLDVPIGDAIRMVLVLPDHRTFAVAHQDDGSWMMLSDHPSEAEPLVIHSILACVAPLRARSLVSWNSDVPREYFDQSDTIMLTITTGAVSPDAGADTSIPTQTHIVRFTKPRAGGGQRVFAWRPGYTPAIIGEVDPAIFDTLQVPLRSRRLWDLPAESIQEIHLSEGLKDAFVLRKSEERWTIPDDPYARVDPAAINDFIESIRRVKASEFLTDSTAYPDRFGLSVPWITIDLVDTDGETHTLKIARTGPTTPTTDHYAIATGVDVIVLIPSDAMLDLAKGPGDMVKD